MTRLSVLLTVLLLTSGTGADERLEPHLSDALHALALTRSDLAIERDYLPDPDRLAVTKRVLNDPISSSAWLRGLAGTLRTMTDDDVVGVAGGLLARGPASPDALRSTRSFANVVELVIHVGAEVRGTSGLHADSELIALVHPDSNLRAPATDRLLAAGRAVPVLKLVPLAIDLVARVCESERDAQRPRSYDTPFGRVTYGTHADDVYDGPHALIVDPGGNDRYVNIAGVSSSSVPVSVVIDDAGHDRYEGGVAVGMGGIGVVIDRGGNDAYVGEDGAQGAGVGGIGILIDLEGDDIYSASVGGQGFGLYGLGILIDAAGNDRFTCDLLGQGSAGPGGVGLLFDRVGDDAYSAGGKYMDFREEGRFARSMSQGFSLGLQTEASGGAGVLIDLEGEDRYEIAYFGQGASHWAGLGALYDRAGDDIYLARRYAQGCGAHLSAGLLVDDSGDDVYSLWAVGQGCGHDLAVGILSEGEGDDRYEVSWLGQGVGNANGTGLLFDMKGDDVFTSEGEDTQGHGIGSRDFGSIGILLDLAGIDAFRRPGGFVTSGTLGVRYDVGKDAP